MEEDMHRTRAFAGTGIDVDLVQRAGTVCDVDMPAEFLHDNRTQRRAPCLRRGEVRDRSLRIVLVLMLLR
jgi:hypothetical protein